MGDSHVLVRVEDLRVHYPMRGRLFPPEKRYVHAVDGVSFFIRAGETLGLVGESGCGKSSTGRAILRLERFSKGRIWFKGIDISTLQGEKLRRLRRAMQLVFQDPFASLDPRMKLGAIVREPLDVHRILRGEEARRRVRELLDLVGLPIGFAGRYPHELSGGQRQRVGIARALAAEPQFIVCDEAVSSLDVSIRSQIINLLMDLQSRLSLTYLFIAHDLSVVRHISDRIAVMYLGRLVELAERKVLYENPLHPYTQALLSAIPIPDPEIEETRDHLILQGEMPNPISPPSGCYFHPRCPLVEDHCKETQPEFAEVLPDHWVACHIVLRNTKQLQ